MAVALASFFETFYVPNNAVLTLAGDIDPAKALEQVERYFGDIPKGEPIPALPGSPDLEPKIGSTVRDDVVADVPLPRVIMAHRIPPYSSADSTPHMVGAPARMPRIAVPVQSMNCDAGIRISSPVTAPPETSTAVSMRDRP